MEKSREFYHGAFREDQLALAPGYPSMAIRYTAGMRRSDGIQASSTAAASAAAASAAAEVAAVDSLIETCRAGTTLELPLHRQSSRGQGEVDQFLYYEQGELVGIATLSPGQPVEVLGMVAPGQRRRGIARQLLAAVAAECRRRGAADYLLVCESASAAGCTFASQLGGSFEFAEHLMAFDSTVVAAAANQGPEDQRDAPSAGKIDVMQATPADITHLMELRRDQHPDDDQSRLQLQSWLNSDAHQVLIALQKQQPVGMIRVTRDDREVWLNSFAVLASRRGRGIGRQVLANILADLPASSTAWLEVETDNEPALALYRSVGFQTKTTYRYYRLTC